jgi:hypothetical protein
VGRAGRVAGHRQPASRAADSVDPAFWGGPVEPAGNQPSDNQPPDIQPPDIQPPDIHLPDIQPPDIQLPDIQPPDIQQPNIQPPDTQPYDQRLASNQPGNNQPASIYTINNLPSTRTRSTLSGTHLAGKQKSRTTRTRILLPTSEKPTACYQKLGTGRWCSNTACVWCSSVHPCFITRSPDAP